MAISDASNSPDAIRPSLPATSGTSGTSQIRNCGETTFEKTTTAVTAAAKPVASSCALSSALRYASRTSTSAPRRKHGSERSEHVRKRAAQVERAGLPGHDASGVHADLVRCEQHGSGKALELELPDDLGLHAEAEAAGRERRERNDQRGDDGREHTERADERSAATRTVDVQRRQRDEHRGKELDRRAGREQPEAEPVTLGEQGDEGENDEENRPHVVAVEDDGPQGHRQHRGQAERDCRLPPRGAQEGEDGGERDDDPQARASREQLEGQVVVVARKQRRCKEERRGTGRVLHVEVAVRELPVQHLLRKLVVSPHISGIGRAQEPSARDECSSDEGEHRDEQRPPPVAAIGRPHAGIVGPGRT